jgi:hypothetical protein
MEDNQLSFELAIHHNNTFQLLNLQMKEKPILDNLLSITLFNPPPLIKFKNV